METNLLIESNNEVKANVNLDKADEIGSWLDGSNRLGENRFQSESQLIVSDLDGWDSLLGIYEQNKKESSESKNSDKSKNFDKSKDPDKPLKHEKSKQIINTQTKNTQKSKTQKPSNQKKRMESDDYEDYEKEYEYEDQYH